MGRRYRFPFKSLDVYQASVEHFGWCVNVLAGASRIPFKVQDQIISAALSMPANIGEANGRWKKPGEVEQHYRYAQGSTYESAAFLDALSALGAIDDDAYNSQEEHLERIARMLTPLMNRASRVTSHEVTT